MARTKWRSQPSSSIVHRSFSSGKRNNKRNSSGTFTESKKKKKSRVSFFLSFFLYLSLSFWPSSFAIDLTGFVLLTPIMRFRVGNSRLLFRSSFILIVGCCPTSKKLPRRMNEETNITRLLSDLSSFSSFVCSPLEKINTSLEQTEWMKGKSKNISGFFGHLISRIGKGQITRTDGLLRSCSNLRLCAWNALHFNTLSKLT